LPRILVLACARRTRTFLNGKTTTVRHPLTAMARRRNCGGERSKVSRRAVPRYFSSPTCPVATIRSVQGSAVSWRGSSAGSREQDEVALWSVPASIAAYPTRTRGRSAGMARSTSIGSCHMHRPCNITSCYNVGTVHVGCSPDNERRTWPTSCSLKREILVAWRYRAQPERSSAAYRQTARVGRWIQDRWPSRRCTKTSWLSSRAVS
jgi:hypothetical protein